jgi:hypothetical protein
LPRQYAASSCLPLCFYLEAGLFEFVIETDFNGEWDLLAAAWYMHNVLRVKACEVYYNEFSSGHNPINWQGALARSCMIKAGV